MALAISHIGPRISLPMSPIEPKPKGTLASGSEVDLEP